MAPAACLQACGLPQAWADQNAWRVLDTRFDQGLQFLSTWQAWQDDARRPRMLHYVALTAAPLQPAQLLAAAAPFPELLALAQELAPQWFGLLPGFHRLTLAGGQVLLTLCVGDVTAMLRAQRFLADTVYLGPERQAHGGRSIWDVWTVKALARCCRRGTRLASTPSASDLQAALTQCGFEMQASQAETRSGAPPRDDTLSGQFNPRWTVRNTRSPSLAQPAAVGSCTIIGAGLAGASVAAALARRGWQVRVLDLAAAPAAGASGLPVGLVVPHVSVDDCTLSRLSRAGVRLVLQQARSLLRQGKDWDASGTLERRIDGSAGLPANWPAPGLDWSRPATQQLAAAPWNPLQNQGAPGNQPAIWHSQAAWLKPAQLVRAWLAHPGITFCGNAQVASVRQHGDAWELLDAQGVVLERASRVVFANACAARPLLAALQASQPAGAIDVKRLPTVYGVRGQLSWAMHAGASATAFPPFPVNGAGSVIAQVPVDGGRAWFVGSSYQPDSQPASPDENNHAANLGRLRTLLPALGQALAPQFDAGSLNAWKNTRCVTADRLPMVGPLYRADNPSLWICAGMGSRGLSFSVLCAELLAAQWGGEPLPVEAALGQALNALRGSAASFPEI